MFIFSSCLDVVTRINYSRCDLPQNNGSFLVIMCTYLARAQVSEKELPYPILTPLRQYSARD